MTKEQYTKFNKDYQYTADAIKVHKLLLQGKVHKHFPNGFWRRPYAEYNAIKCTIYMIK